MNNVFMPGERINLKCLNEKKYKTKVPMTGEKIELEIPSRIHISLLNDEKISLGKPGGGALGLAVDMFQTKISITMGKFKGIKISPEYIPNIEHIIKVFAKAIGKKIEGVNINIKRNKHVHIGFGSSVMQVFGVIFGLNYLFGTPLSNRELRKIIGYNYIENIKGNKKISLGYETGAGVACALYGGLTLLTDQLEIIENIQIDKKYQIVSFVPTKEYIGNKDKKRNFSGEMSVFYESKKFHPLLNATAEKVLYDLIPAMKQKNIGLIGDIIYDLNFMMGTLGTIRSRYSVGYYTLFEKLNELGGIFVGISSTGPMVYALVQKNKSNRIINYIKKQNFIFLGEGAISSGIKIYHNNKKVSIMRIPDLNDF